MGYKYPSDENQQWDYDLYPKVFAAGRETRVWLRQLGMRPRLLPDKSYRLAVCALDGGAPEDFPLTADFSERTVKTDAQANLTFTHTFPSEQAYFLRLFDAEDGAFIEQLPVYCVEGDLVGRYPFQGDTHLHTCYSDGNQTPAVVASNYRRYGYDFLAITDHHRYYPSLEAMRFCESIPTELCACPGEEIQLPCANGAFNTVHIISFGGEYGVNAMIEGVETREVGSDRAFHSLSGGGPEPMTQAEYDALMARLCAEARLPEGIDCFPAVNCKWIFEQIRKANGLGIFAHPNWIRNVFHVPSRFMDYLVEQKLFDAFEVLGGELYYEQNGFQTLRYYEDREKGFRYPVGGATDSHSSYPTNPKSRVATTIVFSERNERRALIDSIKASYSVAVDRISREPRIVGQARLARYASFLLQHYFPLHDELCFEEGRMMKQYATGTDEERSEARAVLGTLYGRVARSREKYFGF